MARPSAEHQALIDASVATGDLARLPDSLLPSFFSAQVPCPQDPMPRRRSRRQPQAFKSLPTCQPAKARSAWGQSEGQVAAGQGSEVGHVPWLPRASRRLSVLAGRSTLPQHRAPGTQRATRARRLPRPWAQQRGHQIRSVHSVARPRTVDRGASGRPGVWDRRQHMGGRGGHAGNRHGLTAHAGYGGCLP